MIENNIIQLIKQRRKELKITQQQLADKLFISKSSYNEIENCKRGMSLDYFLIICKELNLSADNLLNLNKDKIIITFTKEEIKNLLNALDTLNNLKGKLNQLKIESNINITNNNNISIGTINKNDNINN